MIASESDRMNMFFDFWGVSPQKAQRYKVPMFGLEPNQVVFWISRNHLATVDGRNPAPVNR